LLAKTPREDGGIQAVRQPATKVPFPALLAIIETP
jgi:hypothetical protein